jgi:hypothetical protein
VTQKRSRTRACEAKEKQDERVGEMRNQSSRDCKEENHVPCSTAATASTTRGRRASGRGASTNSPRPAALMLRVSLGPDTATAETTTLARAIDLVTGGIVKLRSRDVVG